MFGRATITLGISPHSIRHDVQLSSFKPPNSSLGTLALVVKPAIRRSTATGHSVDRHLSVEQCDDSVVIELHEVIAIEPVPPLCVTEW